MVKTRMFRVFIVLFVSYIGCGFFRWLLFSEKQKPTEVNEVDEEEETSTTCVGSKGFDNYRHEADICDAYHTLRNGGLKDSNIIVFMYDDIAQSSKNGILNPMYGKYGTIIHRPGRNDVYKGVPKDYTGSDVTGANVLAVLEGVKSRLSGGSKKVVVSKSSDRIFVFYSGHGLPGFVGITDGTLIARDQLMTTLNRLDLNKRYISMMINTEDH